MKVALDLHDFSVVNNRLGLLLKLKEVFPDFKVSLFIVTHDDIMDWGPSLLYKEYLGVIKKNLDWLQIIPHSYKHNGREAKSFDTYEFGEMLLPAIERDLKDLELPYVNGYCAPHWEWNRSVVSVLDEMNWWGAVDRDKKMLYTKKYYKYNYLLNEPFYESKDEVLKLHGHVYGTKNDLGECFENLLKLPKDTKWHFVTDFIETL